MLGVDAESDALDVLPIGAAEQGRRARRRSAGGRPSWRTLAIATLVAIAAVVGALQFFGGDDAPADDGAVDPDETEATDLADFDGLIDGDTIDLFVADLPGSSDTVTVQCVPGAEASTGCDPTTIHRAATTPNGVIEEAVQVWRVISTADHGNYDCARRPCEVRTYPPAAGVPVATSSLGFDSQNSAALPVQISVVQPDPSTEELITLQTTALSRGTVLGVSGCSIGVEGDPTGCNELWTREVVAEADGFELDIPAAWWQGNFETLCPDGCRIDFDVSGAERQPFSIHLPPSNRAGLMVDSGSDDIPTALTVTPATGLLDGQEVTIEAAGLTNQMGLYLCADTIVFDCSWLGAPVNADVQTVRVPRAFTSWRGGLRDCAEVECEIVVLGPMNFEDQVSAVIAFDPSIPLEPGRPLNIDAEGPIADGQTVTISVDPNEGAMEWPNMAVCAVDRTEACEYVDSNFTDNAVNVTLYRTLMTPIGPYDCIDDGGCELNVWIDGRTSRFEPLPLEFDPTSPQARQPATVTIRPGGEISDGDTISLTVRGLNPDEFALFASICITGESACAFLGGINGGQRASTTLDLRIRRIITMQNLTTPGAAGPVDCLVVQCEIRLSNVRAGEPALLTFKDEPALPSPEIAIDAPEILATGQQFEIRGRFFTFISLDDEHWLDIQLCRPGEENGTYESCYSIGAIDDGGIDIDAGTFQGTITIPDEPGFRVGGRGICETDCLLVAFDGAGPPGVLPVTIDR